MRTKQNLQSKNNLVLLFRNRKLPNIFIFIFILSVFISPLFAQKATGRQGKPPLNREQKQKKLQMWRDLNLTEEQKTKLKALHDENKQLHKKNMKEMREMRAQIKIELLKDNPDRKELSSFATQVAERAKRMTESRFDHMLKVKKILTKEQFEMMLNRPENRKWLDKGEGPPPGH